MHFDLCVSPARTIYAHHIYAFVSPRIQHHCDFFVVITSYRLHDLGSALCAPVTYLVRNNTEENTPVWR